MIAHNKQVCGGDKSVLLQQMKRWFRIEGMSSSQSNHFSANEAKQIIEGEGVGNQKTRVACETGPSFSGVPSRKYSPVSCDPFIGCSSITIVGRIVGVLVDGRNSFTFRIWSVIDGTTGVVVSIILAHVLLFLVGSIELRQWCYVLQGLFTLRTSESISEA
jgi:hypothetical protein